MRLDIFVLMGIFLFVLDVLFYKGLLVLNLFFMLDFENLVRSKMCMFFVVREERDRKYINFYLIIIVMNVKKLLL